MFPNLKPKTKQEYRKIAKQTRAGLDIQSISRKIYTQLTALDMYKQAESIVAFYAAGDEIDITPVLSDSSKKWYLPVVTDSENMVFCGYKPGDNLVKNRFGVMEPVLSGDIDGKKPEIIILPALMADRSGYRLGYGKGYYDRYLAKTDNNCFKIVLIPDELLIESLPHDGYDIPADIIITQSSIYTI